MEDSILPTPVQAPLSEHGQSPSLPAERHSLLTHHRALIEASAIREDVATARGYRSVTDKADLQCLGFKSYQCLVPALLIPFHGVGGNGGIHEIRPDKPRVNPKGKPRKYERPTGSRAMLDVPPSVRPQLADPTVPLYITEGARKADSAASVGLCCISLAGVWGWRGRNENGGKTALSDWNAVALNAARPVFIVFDSDAASNPEVQKAERALAGWLESRGAKPRVIRLPPALDGAKMGLDDYLASGRTADDLHALVEKEPARQESRIAGDRYMVRDGAIWREKDSKVGPMRIPLCTFTARIVEEITRDDGAERWKEIVVEGSLQDGRPLPRTNLKSNQFDAMNWPSVEWGNEAVVHAGNTTRDHLRVAVRTLSDGVTYRTVYGHFGWRECSGAWVYLHAAGAIGAQGAVDGIEVNPGEGRLRDYHLPAPPKGKELVEAVRASLQLLDLAHGKVMVPLLAAVYRAPLCEALPADLALYLEGASGSQKTALTAVAQAHYGAAFDGRNLPANWHSTANALERQAFRVKDALLTVDDFAPSGTAADIQRLHREAERLFRAVGNRSGRARMNADGTLRPEYFPRGMIVSSGEDVPAGHSLRARLFIVNVSKGAVDLARLTAAQESAANGQLAAALSGYVQWLATILLDLRAELPGEHRRVREEARSAVAGHDRTPDALAHLVLGWDTFLRFAEQSGAITGDKRRQLRAMAWEALCAVARDQSEHHTSEDPVHRFLGLLRAVLESGAAHVVAFTTEGEPDDPARWGWRGAPGKAIPSGARIGWTDNEVLYLERNSVYTAVQEMAHRQGAALPITQTSLWKRLSERGVTIKADGNHKAVKVTIRGRRLRVLALRLEGLSSISGASGTSGAEAHE